ncbi:hypothetical protein MMC25_006066 [Agyrium rufum]|nr:hypothetical protein [Agyrium rufum]
MLYTRPLMAPGFARRSLDEFKRLSRIAINLEGLHVPTVPFVLANFTNPDMTSMCKTMCDKEIGGFSEVHLDHVSANEAEPAHARFHGTISTRLPANRPKVQRTGFAAWRTLDRKSTIFGKSLWDIDPYTFLALRVKSDGRKYFVNVQSESIVHTDIHQHRLYAKRSGEWETILIKWNDFVRTNHGAVVEPQSEILRQKVRTIGIGSTDRVPGPFDLGISRIWATNNSEGAVENEGNEIDFG